VVVGGAGFGGGTSPDIFGDVFGAKFWWRRGRGGRSSGGSVAVTLRLTTLELDLEKPVRRHTVTIRVLPWSNAALRWFRREERAHASPGHL